MSDYIIEAQAHTRYRIRTADGRAARLAIIDDDGNILAAGDQVSKDAWDIAQECHENLWQGQGFLTVTTLPGGVTIKDRKAAA